MAAKLFYHHKPEKGMRGPFPLNVPTINTFSDDAYGVYMLVCMGDDGATIVVYVGRGLLKERLTEHLDEKPLATGFVYKLLRDDFAGFEEECRLFHDYGKTKNLLNKRHPARPAGSGRSFPKCSEQGCNGEGD
jgi:hypothetical protein